MPNSNGGNISGFKLSRDIALEVVLQIEQTALKAWTEGRQIVEWSGNGTEVKKEFVASPGDILAECTRWKKINYPQIYGYVVRQSNMLRLG